MRWPTSPTPSRRRSNCLNPATSCLPSSASSCGHPADRHAVRLHHARLPDQLLPLLEAGAREQGEMAGLQFVRRESTEALATSSPRSRACRTLHHPRRAAALHIAADRSDRTYTIKKPRMWWNNPERGSGASCISTSSKDSNAETEDGEEGVRYGFKFLKNPRTSRASLVRGRQDPPVRRRGRLLRLSRHLETIA